MKQPHKHAAIIKAWADGESIEYNGIGGKWLPVTEAGPCWMESVEYRIKPEPTHDEIAFGIVEVSYRKDLGSASCRTMFRVSEHWENDNVMFTFDGETGKLKSAEVMK